MHAQTQVLFVPLGTASCLHRSSNPFVLAFGPLSENPSWEGRVRASQGRRTGFMPTGSLNCDKHKVTLQVQYLLFVP